MRAQNSSSTHIDAHVERARRRRTPVVRGGGQPYCSTARRGTTSSALLDAFTARWRSTPARTGALTGLHEVFRMWTHRTDLIATEARPPSHHSHAASGQRRHGHSPDHRTGRSRRRRACAHREAASSFGDDRLFGERLAPAPAPRRGAGLRRRPGPRTGHRVSGSPRRHLSTALAPLLTVGNTTQVPRATATRRPLPPARGWPWLPRRQRPAATRRRPGRQSCAGWPVYREENPSLDYPRPPELRGRWPKPAGLSSRSKSAVGGALVRDRRPAPAHGATMRLVSSA